MSTLPTTPNVAPDPATMPLADLRAQVSAPAPVAPAAAPSAADPAPAVASPDAAPSPFEIVESQSGVEIKLQTGQVYKGATIKEAAGKLAAAQLEASRTISDLRKPPADVPAPAPALATGYNPQAVAEKYSSIDLQRMNPQDFNAMYYSALASDPAEAQALANARSFGYSKVGEFYQSMGQMQQTSEVQVARDLTVQFFSEVPQYPATPEAAEAVTESLKQIGIDPDVVVPTVAQMKAAYHLAVSQDKIKPLTAEEITAQRAGVYSMPKPPTPPPTIPSNSPDLASADTDANLRTMPLDQLRAMILRGGK